MTELTRRYVVMAMSAEGPFDPEDPEAPFVLKPWKDPAALLALEAYRRHCYPELAEELTRWIATIRAGPVVRGGVGGRNDQYLAARAAPAAKVGRPAGRSSSAARRVKSARGRAKAGRKRRG